MVENIISPISKIEDTRKEMTNTLLSTMDLLESNQFGEAAAEISMISKLSDFMKKEIEICTTQFIRPIYETVAKFSFTFEDVERKKEAVYKWLDEILQLSEELRHRIRAETLKEALYKLRELGDKIHYDLRFLDLINTLVAIAMEFAIYRIHTTEDMRVVIFDELRLHPIIKKASRELFKDGHYAQAIFEAYKALINYVKEKSGEKTLDGVDLIGKVFSIKYDKTLKVIKKPVLQLNELRTQEDMDEQKGFMHLYMGAVIGIRNPKAHGIDEQRDPYKTLEYLSFASLLAKRVDEAKLNTG
jgi:uncharacterized protein (TIGR02391 family)